VIAVRMAEVAVDEIVDMIPMRHRVMAAMQSRARKKTPRAYYFLMQCYNIALCIAFNRLRAKDY
jgi:hypothetical protein